jgi:hypothetical protein
MMQQIKKRYSLFCSKFFSLCFLRGLLSLFLLFRIHFDGSFFRRSALRSDGADGYGVAGRFQRREMLLEVERGAFGLAGRAALVGLIEHGVTSCSSATPR